MGISRRFPFLFEVLDDESLESRHLLTVDENYEDYDSEEFEYDPEDFNYVIYIAEPVQKLLGMKKMEELMHRLNEKDIFEHFMATELDLYGVKTVLDQAGIEQTVLSEIEDMLR